MAGLTREEQAKDNEALEQVDGVFRAMQAAWVMCGCGCGQLKLVLGDNEGNVRACFSSDSQATWGALLMEGMVKASALLNSSGVKH